VIIVACQSQFLNEEKSLIFKNMLKGVGEGLSHPFLPLHTPLERVVWWVGEEREGWGEGGVGWRGEKMAQTMYAHVSK
jgi:hypothetical protein